MFLMSEVPLYGPELLWVAEGTRAAGGGAGHGPSLRHPVSPAYPYIAHCMGACRVKGS